MPTETVKQEIEQWNDESKETEELLKILQSKRTAMIDHICNILEENGFYAYWYRDKWDRCDRDPKAGILLRVCPLSISSEFGNLEEPSQHSPSTPEK